MKEVSDAEQALLKEAEIGITAPNQVIVEVSTAP